MLRWHVSAGCKWKGWEQARSKQRSWKLLGALFLFEAARRQSEPSATVGVELQEKAGPCFLPPASPQGWAATEASIAEDSHVLSVLSGWAMAVCCRESCSIMLIL